MEPSKVNYLPVIGLEVHLELNTKTKMFCSCSSDYFGKSPNTHTCPVCLGLPGALPFTNQKALEDCLKIGLALNCSISDKSLFERKNYFYPDLPKGYQISQYRWPLCSDGFIEVKNIDGEIIKIRINRVHQEEDTGKLSHLGEETVIDFNRSGLPLVEIVTEPDFSDTESVKNYSKALQQIFRYLKVSDADMEKGDMRLEANVSVRPEGSQELPNYRVELKNINSFKFMAEAIEYEVKRQIELIEKGEKITQHTRGWNENKKETFVQREKEEANDYRYFPEPDLGEVKIKNQELGIKQEIPELPEKKVQRFQKDYGLNESQATILTSTQELADFFETSTKTGNPDASAKDIANLLINQKVDILKITPEQILELISQKQTGIVEDLDTLNKFAQEVISENPKVVEDYKSGKVNAISSLIGGVMRKTQGKADSQKLKTILEQLLTS